MIRLARILLVTAALLSSGAVQATLAAGEDRCCAGEDGSSPDVPDCPPGVSCACCPARAQLAADVPELAPCEALASSVPQRDDAVVARAVPSDIFHPPRA